jgi:hypothetical protein
MLCRHRTLIGRALRRLADEAGTHATLSRSARLRETARGHLLVTFAGHALPFAVRLPRLQRAVAKMSPGNGSHCTLALYSGVVEKPFLIRGPPLSRLGYKPVFTGSGEDIFYLLGVIRPD